MNAAKRIGSAGLMVGVFAVLVMAPARADDNTTLHDAADKALEGVSANLANVKLPDDVKSIAVAQLFNDYDGYITERVRDAVAQAHQRLFTREEIILDDLLGKEEIFNIRRGDLIKPETLQSAKGKLEGVDTIMYGTIWDNDINLWSIRGHVKVSLVLADVETGQELWRSGPLEGEAFMHWSDALMHFWRFPVLLLIGFLLLIIILLALRSLRKAYKPI